MKSNKFDNWEIPEIDDWDEEESQSYFYGGCRPRFYGYGFCYPRQFFTCFPRPCYPI